MIEVENKTKHYESYKDSGISWLEQVPEHWELKRFKHIFKEKKITHNVDLNCGSISFGKVVYKDDEKIPVSTKKSYQVLNKGEFLINPLNLNYDLKSLRIGLSDKDVVVSSGYIIVQNTTEISKDYYKWLLHIFDVTFMKTLGSGVRQTLSFTHIANSELVFPPLPEQTAIAQFLDDKTAKIEQAIAIKAQQINLLKERKQILIHKAVTRGLDDSVTLKDSGVEWIGEIPEHWEVLDIRRITNEHKQGYYPTEGYVKEGIKLLRITDFRKDGNLDTSDCPMVEDLKEVYSYILEKGDFVFARTGGAGNFAIFPDIEEKVAFASYLIRFRFDLSRLCADYLKYYFNSSAFMSGVERNIHGGVNQNIHAEDIKAQKITLPSLEEQLKIVKQTNSASQKIETAISLKQQEIERLKEYKSSLINEVVTGKVRVC